MAGEYHNSSAIFDIHYKNICVVINCPSVKEKLPQKAQNYIYIYIILCELVVFSFVSLCLCVRKTVNPDRHKLVDFFLEDN